MTISVYRFDEQLDAIKNNLRNYEFIIFDTVSTAKNVSFYWNDGYTNSFFSEIDKEIHFTNDLINTLYHLCSSLTSISMLYNDINQKKRNLLGLAGSVVDLNHFVVSVNDEEEIAARKRYLYNKTVNAEDRISQLLSRVDVPFIRKITFDNLSIEPANQGFIGMLAGIDNEIQKLEINVQNAMEKSNVLKNSLYAIASFYNSRNSGKITDIVENFEKELQTLNSNLERAVEYIRNRKTTYENMVAEIAKKAEDIKFDN